MVVPRNGMGRNGREAHLAEKHAHLKASGGIQEHKVNLGNHITSLEASIESRRVASGGTGNERFIKGKECGVFAGKISGVLAGRAERVENRWCIW